MKKYTYKARDRQGNLIKGIIDADDPKDLRKRLDATNHFLIDFSEKGLLPKNISLFGKKIFSPLKVSSRDLSFLSWQLYSGVEAGISLTKAIEIVGRQIENKKLKIALAKVRGDIDKGYSFSQALEEHPDVFPPLFVHMITSGEVGGVLDYILKRLSEYYEREAEIKSKIRSALAYPIVLITFTVGLCIFLFTFALPRFTAVFADLGVSLPLPTRILLTIGRLAKINLYISPFIFIGTIVIVKILISLPKGRYLYDSLKLKLPLIGNLIIKSSLSRFNEMLSILTSSGIPLFEVLKIIKNDMGNKILAGVVDKAIIRVGEGKSLADALNEGKIFPELTISMINVGEETGNLSKTMERVAHYYEHEVDVALNVFAKILEPVLLIFMTIIIGFIAVSVFLPMADLIGNMGQY
ncbi:MAG: type II secretion system F family protein [bacterium]